MSKFNFTLSLIPGTAILGHTEKDQEVEAIVLKDPGVVEAGKGKGPEVEIGTDGGLGPLETADPDQEKEEDPEAERGVGPGRETATEDPEVETDEG